MNSLKREEMQAYNLRHLVSRQQHGERCLYPCEGPELVLLLMIIMMVIMLTGVGAGLVEDVDCTTPPGSVALDDCCDMFDVVILDVVIATLMTSRTPVLPLTSAGELSPMICSTNDIRAAELVVFYPVYMHHSKTIFFNSMTIHGLQQ